MTKELKMDMENENIKLKTVRKDIGMSRIDLPLEVSLDVLNLIKSAEVDCNLLKERLGYNTKNGETAILDRLSETIERVSDILFW